MKSIPLVVLVAGSGFLQATGSGCGDCWCVPSVGDRCPAWRPQNYTADTELQAALAAQRALNAQSLSCNPYVDESCDTSPPLSDLNSTHGAVCGIQYSDAACSAYTLSTFASREAALQQGFAVTHTGSCGVCSTTQDLAVYMKIFDMTSAGEACAIQALVSEAKGLACYLELGLTEPCAYIWLYDGIYDSTACVLPCARDINEPYNIPPTCELNDCLQCDEVKAGPIFKLFAGRTRRRSGIESAIQRPCGTVSRVHQAACPVL
jgi:hypothetical protein